MPTADRLSDVARPDAALVVISPLLVLGSRGLGGFTSLLVGSVAVELVAHGHCPVVVVRGDPPAADNRRAFCWTPRVARCCWWSAAGDAAASPG